MRNLLDGHPDLFTLPFESHFFQYYGYWVQNNYRYSTPRKYSLQSLIEVYVDFIAANNVSDDKLGDAFVFGKFNVQAFENYFAQLKPEHSISEAFQLFIDGAHISLFGESLPSGKCWVEKSVEHAEFAMDIRKAFPDSKFIHVVRNPYSNLVSLRKYKSIGHGYPLIHRVMQTLENSYYHLERNQRLLDNYMVIQYEELLQSPESTMKSVARFIDVPYNDGLLQPTHLGGQWRGNSTSGKEFSGIASENLSGWKKQIRGLEVYYINRMFPFILNEYGYERYESGESFFKPCQGENLSRYLVNRFYKFYLP